MKEIIENLDGIKREFLEKENDYLLVIDGREGSGKSSLALLCAEYIDKNFSLDKIAFSGKELLNLMGKVEDSSAIIFDEAAEGLYSSESLAPMNIMISKALMISRVKKLFIIIVIPSFFILNKYVRLFRLGMLFHIINRGKVNVYSHHNKRITKLVILGGKFFDYDCVRPTFQDDFPKYHGELWEEYMKYKRDYVNKHLSEKERKKFYSLLEGAKRLNVSATWLKKRINEGQIKPHITKTGRFMITDEELSLVE